MYMMGFSVSEYLGFTDEEITETFSENQMIEVLSSEGQ